MGWFKELLQKNRKQKNIIYMQNTNWPKEKILEHAVRANLESVIVVGWTKEGAMYVNSTYAKRGDLYWDLQLAARNVMDR